jgi:pimeloyl-ACP methyl ester carboxylesterase
MGVRVSASSLAAELEAFAGAPDLRDDIGRLDVPLLLRVGELDISTPKERARRIMPCARRAILNEVPNVGHALLLEDFDGTATAIEEHLSKA